MLPGVGTQGGGAGLSLGAILGPLSERLDYVALYRDALVHHDFDRTAKEIEEAIQQAVEAGNILDSLCQGLEPFNLNNYRAIRGEITWDDLAQFVTRGLSELGARFTWQNELLSVEVPDQLLQRPGVAER